MLPPDTRAKVLLMVGKQSDLILDPAFKYTLAPLISSDHEQQQTVYRLWETYLEQLKEIKTAPDDIIDRPPLPPKYLKYLLRALLLFVLLIVTLLVVDNCQQPEPVTCECSENITVIGHDWLYIGDTVTYIILFTCQDTVVSLAQKEQCSPFRWEASLDGKSLISSDGELGAEKITFKVPAPEGESSEVIVSVGHTDPAKWNRTIFTKIHCLDAPNIDSIILPRGKLETGAALDFASKVFHDTLVVYEWQINGEIQSYESAFTYSFQQAGEYQIELTVKDTINNRKAVCEDWQTETIVIGSNLAPVPLYEDTYFEELNIPEMVVIKSWVYVLLGLLPLLSIFFWWKWWQKKRDAKLFKPSPSKEQEQKWGAKFNAPDAAPYWLQYVEKDKDRYVAVHQTEQLIAQNLRQRQAAEKEKIDVSTTINKAIAKAGYLDVQFRQPSTPSDYIFLIDVESKSSHMAQLFQYLCRRLMQQDVHATVFFYQRHLNVCWNRQHTSGIKIKDIQRKYGNRRLLIFGEAYTLIDDESDHKSQSANTAMQVLREWKQRLLITATPIADWNFREARLYKHFGIFPADLIGMLRAVQFIVAGADENLLLPTLAEWEQSFEDESTDRYLDRRWETLREHADYLNDPQLALWFAALSVAPPPNWVTTIAIGEALDVPVNYDTLLLLARTPSLRNGQFSESLQEEMWAYLEKRDNNEKGSSYEKIARKAALGELNKLEESHDSGYVNKALQISIAVQEFSIDPANKAHQEKIGYLLNKGILKQGELKTLDRAVRLYKKKKYQPSRNNGTDIKVFLSGENISQPKYFINLLLVLLPALMALGLWWGINTINDCPLSNSLHFLATCKPQVNSLANRHNTLIKEYKDSILNQVYFTDAVEGKAVELDTFNDHQNRVDDQLNNLRNEARSDNTTPEHWDAIIGDNLAKIRFNHARLHYYLGSTDDQNWAKSDSLFTRAQSTAIDSLIKWESIHARGLIAKELEQDTLACTLLKQLQAETDYTFFSNRKLPNLSSLADCDTIKKVVKITIFYQRPTSIGIAEEIRQELVKYGYEIEKVELNTNYEDSAITYTGSEYEDAAKDTRAHVNAVLGRQGYPLVRPAVLSLSETAGRKIFVFLDLPPPPGRGICMQVSDIISFGLVLRNRPLNREELNSIQNNRNSSLNLSTQIVFIPPGTEIELMDSIDLVYYVRHENQEGYVVKQYNGESTLIACKAPDEPPPPLEEYKYIKARLIDPETSRPIAGAKIFIYGAGDSITKPDGLIQHAFSKADDDVAEKEVTTLRIVADGYVDRDYAFQLFENTNTLDTVSLEKEKTEQPPSSNPQNPPSFNNPFETGDTDLSYSEDIPKDAFEAYRFSLEMFSKGASIETQQNFSETSDTIRPPRDYYNIALQAIEKALERERTLSKSEILGNALALNAMIYWKLGNNTEAEIVAARAKPLLQDQKGDARDYAMMMALRPLIELDFAFVRLQEMQELRRNLDSTEDQEQRNNYYFQMRARYDAVMDHYKIKFDNNAEELWAGIRAFDPIIDDITGNNELKIYFRHAQLAGLDNWGDMINELNLAARRLGLTNEAKQWEDEQEFYEDERDRILTMLVPLLPNGTNDSFYLYWREILGGG